MIVGAQNEKIRFVLVPFSGNSGIAAGIENGAILERGQAYREIDTAVGLLGAHQWNGRIPRQAFIRGANKKRLAARLTIELGTETDQKVSARSPREARE